jgi:hypothetical protein
MMFWKVFGLVLLSFSIMTARGTHSTDHNTSRKTLLQKAVEQEIKNEEKYAKEQKFYNADEYNFKAKEVDPDYLKDIQPIEVDLNHTDDYSACDDN